MDRNTRWRTFWLALLTVLAICVLVPSLVPSTRMPRWFNNLFDQKMQLGLDLQGGLYIVYSIDLDKAVDDKASEIQRDIDSKLEELGIEGRVTTPPEPVGAVTITLENPADKQRIDDKFLSDYSESIDMRECPPEQKDSAVCIRVSPDFAAGIREAALDQAIITIRDRINARGIAEPSVKKKGDQVVVELPGLDAEARQRVKDLIARTAKLEFKMVDNGSPYMEKLAGQVSQDPKARELGITQTPQVWRHDSKGELRDWYLMAEDREETFTIEEARARGCWNRNLRVVQGTVKCQVTGRERIATYLEELGSTNPGLKVDEGHQIGYEYVRPQGFGDDEDDRPFWRTYYLHRPVELSGSAITEAFVTFEPDTNQPAVLVRFNRYGGRRFGDMTSANVGKKMAIILDEKVISAPVIQTSIRGGSSLISMGGGTNEAVEREAKDLVAGLKTGSLPAPLQEESSNDIGPLLGRDAVDKAKFSFGLGSLMVVLIMIWYYRRSGVISIGALSLNLLFMMAILAFFGATLTLPGIAALVLTVGMAVDANIIIYERIREELKLGKSIRGAVDAGFSRAFTAIFDGQITTAVAGYVLMQYGSGPIRGFAVMLIIGIITTLFTTTWCTRLFFEYYVGKGRKVTQISI